MKVGLTQSRKFQKKMIRKSLHWPNHKIHFSRPCPALGTVRLPTRPSARSPIARPSAHGLPSVHPSARPSAHPFSVSESSSTRRGHFCRMPPPRGAALLGYNIQYAWLEYFSISFFFGIVATVPLARRLLMMMTFAKESKTKQIIWLCSCGCGCFLWLWLCLWPCGTRRRPCGTRRTTKSPEIVKKICLTKKHKKTQKTNTNNLQTSPEICKNHQKIIQILGRPRES